MQIETEIIFSLVGILAALQRCCLQVENLDKINTIAKNWLDDFCIDYTPNKTMKNYLKVEGFLAYDTYELIEEAKYFEDMNVDGA